MGHTTEKKVVGRQPFAAIKLSLDYCTRTYGRDECSVGRVANNQSARGGSANTITLDLLDTSLTDTLKGFVIFISAGAGSGQEGRITSNDETTKVATVATNWSIQPNNTSIYTLIDRTTACYNTRATCLDVPNYNASTTENEIWLTSSVSDFPEDIWDEVNLGVAVPTLKSISATPPKIDVAGGLGQRASISAMCEDFSHHDRGVDKYALNRLYVPEQQGTFWGKFLARNIYYQGRVLTYYDGYLVNGLFDTANFHERTYIIEKFTGPDNTGRVKIIAKDVLKLADENRSFAPLPSVGTLLVDLLVAETGSFALAAGLGAAYPSTGGVVRINSEIIQYVSRVGDVFSTLTRQSWGTLVADHKATDNVQQCLPYTDTNVVDIIYDLYSNYTNIDSAYLPLTEWEAERDSFLTGNTLTAVISEPVGVNTLVKELVQQNLIYMWWADAEKKIKLKAYAPITTSTALTDDNNFVQKSMKVWHEPKLRISQFWIYYGLRDYTDDGTDNYRFLHINIDTDSEGVDKYDETRLRVIKSRWIDEGNAGLVVQISGRTLALLTETPRMAKFRLDAKDAVETGDFINVTTRVMQSADGAEINLSMLVTEKRQIEQGTTYEYTAQEFVFAGRYGFIGPADLPDYTADVLLKQDAGELLTENGDAIALEEAVVLDGATSEQKSKYAWIAPDSGFFANGDEAYKIL